MQQCLCFNACLLQHAAADDDDDFTAASLLELTEERSSTASSSNGDTESDVDLCDKQHRDAEFALLKWTYLVVTFVVMLADGLQGALVTMACCTGRRHVAVVVC